MKTKKVVGKLWIGPGVEIYDILDKAGKADWSHPDRPTIGVLNVADDFPERPHKREVLYVHAGLNDGPEDWSAPWGEHNSVEAYVNAIVSLDYLISNQDLVYVHCHGGVSRACFVVVMYMSWIWEVTFEQSETSMKGLYQRMNIHPKHREMIQDVNKALENKERSSYYSYWQSWDQNDVIGG